MRAPLPECARVHVLKVVLDYVHPTPSVHVHGVAASSSTVSS